MAKKFKCDDCHTEHGGFHLCLGVIPLPEFKGNGKFLSQSQKTVAFLEGQRQKTFARDTKILKMYEEGAAVREIEVAAGVSRQTIREVVKRMGGTIRDKSWKPEGWISNNRFTAKKKENVDV